MSDINFIPSNNSESEEEQIFPSDREKPILVESFTLLPGENLLNKIPNVVHLSIVDSRHRIGTLYQTNFQFFFIEDSTHQLIVSMPNGLINEIKKLKGHVTVKYHDNPQILKLQDQQITPINTKIEPQPDESSSSNINSNLISEKILQTPESQSSNESPPTIPPQIPVASLSNNKKISRSSSHVDSLNHSNSWYSNGISEKALIIEVRCKDFNLIRFCLPFDEKGVEGYNLMMKLSQLDNPTSSFAYYFSPYLPSTSYNGWNIYDPIEEYTRQGLLVPGSEWRLTKMNQKFELCQTYPQHLIIPFSISDYLLNKSSLYRQKNRFPVCTWRHRYTHATLSRSSQPSNGIGKNRCEEDELLVQAIRKSTPSSSTTSSLSPLYIFDARSKSNVGFSGSAENISNYNNCILEYGGLSNIHELRESQTKLFKLVRNWDDKKSWSEVHNTHWLNHISKLLATSRRILHCIHVEGLSVLIHCIDGWDRTCQLMSLVQLLADPYYRTIKGFIVLICKEWVSFGHKFMTRAGSNANFNQAKQTSPVFLQFIDAVWQLTKQFPTSFEFSDQFLHVLLLHVNSNLFGSFLFDSEKERIVNKVHTETVSIWNLLYHSAKDSPTFLNPIYVKTTENEEKVLDLNNNNNGSNGAGGFVVRKNFDNANVLFPNVQGVQLWTDYYLKWKTQQKISKKPISLIENALRLPGVNGDLMVIQKRRKRHTSRRSKTTTTTTTINTNKSNSAEQLIKSSERKHSDRKSKKSRRSNKPTEEVTKSPFLLSNLESSKVENPPLINNLLENNEITTSNPNNNENIINTNENIIIGEDSNSGSSSDNKENEDSVVPNILIEKVRRHSTSNSSPSIKPINSFIETDSPVVVSPRIEIVNNEEPITTTTTTTTTTITQQEKDKDKETRRLEKEKRRQEKEKKHKERQERKEAKRQEKEKKHKERQKEKEKELLAPKADISVVLKSNGKSKPISLTMPVRGSKSRISIFSTSSPQQISHFNSENENNNNNPNPITQSQNGSFKSFKI